MTDPHPEDQRLVGISARAFEHPADRAATAALRSIPMLDVVVRKLIEFGYERALRQSFLAGSVRLGPDQLPEAWASHRAALARLDIHDVPDLYLTQFPIANAFTFGSGKPVVVMNSELIRLLDDEGRRVVLAHEAAHVHSDHVLYRTALVILIRLGTSVRLPILAGLPLMAITMALLEWSRAAELSCDRAAALVTRDPQAVSRALMTIAAGEAADELNLDAFIAQGMDYEEKGSGLERLTKMMQDLQVTHPMPVRRVRMLLDWVHAGEYDAMVRGEYLRRGDEPSAREEAATAANHYGEKIGDAIQSAGSSVAEMGKQLGDWLDRNKPSS
jgi:Zn-dependent protease with chaperone function